MRALVWHGKSDVPYDSVPDPKIEDSRDSIVKIMATASWHLARRLRSRDHAEPTESAAPIGIRRSEWLSPLLACSCYEAREDDWQKRTPGWVCPGSRGACRVIFGIGAWRYPARHSSTATSLHPYNYCLAQAIPAAASQSGRRAGEDFATR
jgi:hypothetical protein